MRPPAVFARAFGRVLEFLCLAFGVAMGGLIVLTCLDVGMRAVGKGSLPWLVELTEYVMYAGTFLAAPWVLRQGSHVRVDMVLIWLPKDKAVFVERCVDAVGITVSAVLVCYGAAAAYQAFRDHMIAYKTWSVPEGLLLVPIPLAGLLLAIEFGLRFARFGVERSRDPTARASV